MSTTAPKPPTKRLLLAAGLAGGITIGVWAVVVVGNLVFDGIPEVRMPYYIAAGLIGILATGYLGTRYALQKYRRDAWWDGFAAGDEPLAEVVQLRGLKSSDDGDARDFRADKPS